MKLVHWLLMGGLLHLLQRGGTRAGPQSAQVPSRCIPKCNTTHPSTASVPTIVLLFNGLLLCGLIVALKGLKYIRHVWRNVERLKLGLKVNIKYYLIFMSNLIWMHVSGGYRIQHQDNAYRHCGYDMV